MEDISQGKRFNFAFMLINFRNRIPTGYMECNSVLVQDGPQVLLVLPLPLVSPLALGIITPPELVRMEMEVGGQGGILNLQADPQIPLII
jgi:hypothetical protein